MRWNLVIRNRQRRRAVNGAALRRATGRILDEFIKPESCVLGIHLVGEEEMALVNETFLGHHGSTDVITFDHNDAKDSRNPHGELYICLDDAVKQARAFRTTWYSELTRYLVHGLLHLQGFDDRSPKNRRAMKREENRVMREIAKRFPLSTLARRRDKV